jgi:hypothetical protein
MRLFNALRRLRGRCTACLDGNHCEGCDCCN